MVCPNLRAASTAKCWPRFAWRQAARKDRALEHAFIAACFGQVCRQALVNRPGSKNMPPQVCLPVAGLTVRGRWDIQERELIAGFQSSHHAPRDDRQQERDSY